ncbi:RNA-directed DNA polymerase, eukaryota [Tanacetum coccineum]
MVPPLFINSSCQLFRVSAGFKTPHSQLVDKKFNSFSCNGFCEDVAVDIPFLSSTDVRKHHLVTETRGLFMKLESGGNCLSSESIHIPQSGCSEGTSGIGNTEVRIITPYVQLHIMINLLQIMRKNWSLSYCVQLLQESGAMTSVCMENQPLSGVIKTLVLNTTNSQSDLDGDSKSGSWDNLLVCSNISLLDLKLSYWGSSFEPQYERLWKNEIGSKRIRTNIRIHFKNGIASSYQALALTPELSADRKGLHGGHIIGKNFQVFVKEIRTWNIHISNDIKSNDSDNEDISSNGNVDPNEALDDFLQHVVEEKEVEKTPSKDPKAEDSKPRGLEKGPISTMMMLHHEQEMKMFHSLRISTSRAGKCSTSFANYSRKDLKGFSFIDEMNRMIEVGGALGYDVKGCKKYLSDNYIIVEGKWKNPVGDYYIINVYGPQHQPDKSNLWSYLRVFIQDHIGRVILFGDLNEVRSESKRFGSTFSCRDATIFKSFIHDTGLIGLPMGGRHFTWVNKVGSKMSKLDCFLISDDVLHSNTDLKVIALCRLWSDHNPILLYCKKMILVRSC